MQRIVEAKQVLTMKVNSTPEWNRILTEPWCGCDCAMPVCPSPMMLNTSLIYAYVHPMLYKRGGAWYRTERYNYKDGGFDQSTYTGSYFGRITSHSLFWSGEDTTFEEENSSGEPRTGQATVQYLDQVDLAQAATDGEAWARSRTLDWANQSYDQFPPQFFAGRKQVGDGINVEYLLRFYFARFRWFRPQHFGQQFPFYQVVWDVQDTPANGAPYLYQQDQSYTWTVPFDWNDETTHLSDWIHLTPPPDEGTRKVVNVRTYCYNSAKFGRKPTL
jgi:hypothetical protein